MSLTLQRSKLERLVLGNDHRFERGTLSLDRRALEAEIEARDSRIVSAALHVVAPGDSARILCVKDVVEPRCKIDGAIGSGTTRVVENLAVVTCGPIVGFQEGIIDMSGPGAALTPFSSRRLLVLELGVEARTPAHEHEALVRVAGVRLAETVARLCAEAAPERSEEILWDEREVDPTRPRIAYVDMLLSQGLLHDTYVLGHNAQAGLPRVLDPRVVLDTGIVSGNCVSACDKNTTFHHQNNPVATALLAGHGQRWNFLGVVATNEPTRLAEKRKSAERAIALVRELGADGVVISKEGFGNPDADLMMLVRGLEQSGIKTVALTDEYAGSDGGSQSLADATPEADALVSTGNANARVELPAMTTTIGPLPDVARLAGGYAQSVREDGSMEVEIQAIIGSTNQLGFGRLSCREA